MPTQQLYDAQGNVRVQIGQDNTGAFNFIVRGEDGTTDLFDEHGITENAINDGLIKNDMLADNSISEDKLSFPVIKENEYGGIDITQIFDCEGILFGDKITSFQTETTEKLDDSLEIITETINGVSSITDANEKAS